MSRTRVVGQVALACICLVLVSALDAQAQARITASTMDSDGNVYVTGWRVLPPPAVAEILTIKYDRHGDLQWTHTYPDDPARPQSEGWGIAVDPWGNAYVAGHVGTNDNVDCLLIKYPAGYVQGNDPEWIRTYDRAHGHDQNWTIATDPDGYVYVTGYSQQDTSGTNADIVTMKYDSQGTMVWGTPRFYNGPANANEHAFAITVDPVTRNVYVTGTSRNTATSYDMVTIMYDANGIEQWVQRYGGPVDGFNRGTSLALDADGNVYVTGWSQGTGTANADIVTIRYDLAGQEAWVSRYDGPAGSSDSPAPPAGGPQTGSGANTNYIQNNQGIIVTTETLDPGPAVEYLIWRVSGLDLSPDVKAGLVAKLRACLAALGAANADLRQNARHVLEAFVNQFQTPPVVTVVPDDEVLELLAIADQIGKAILGIATTVVYVAGQSVGAGTNVDFALIKYNAADGHPMWNLPGQPGTTPENAGTPPDVALRYNGPADYIDRGWGMAMDMDGNVYVTGPAAADLSVSVDFFTIKYFVNTYQPVALAEGRYDGPGHSVDQSCGFATWRDPASGRLYIFRDPLTHEDLVGVTGNSRLLATSASQEYATVMYDGALAELWVRRY